MFTLNFTRKVLGPRASGKLMDHEVTQTVRAATSDIVNAIISGELRAGDELRVALDGQDVGAAVLTSCDRISAIGLTDEDAQRGGFSSVEALQTALKRAGYRFKPLIDYVFYRVQFKWKME